ncbi:MAG: family 16 glycosylhydrolase [Candidatus Izemoplasmatales bacterium]
MKKTMILGVFILLSVMFVACDEVVTTTSSSLSESTTTTLSEVTTETDSCKATNMSYDYNSLNYNLVFADEFDKETGTPSINKWRYQTGDGGWGNNELQYYTDGNNSIIENYEMVITARKEDMGDSHYTSSRMNSIKSFLYGKFEIKAKLPAGSGTWPAIWMMPSASMYGGWPNSGEIDIMEHVGTDMNKIHFSVHTEKYYFKINTQKTFVATIPNVSTTYHVYGLEWLPDKLIFSVDGTQYFTYTPTDYVACPTSAEWPFDRPFYLILNIALGGWGGTPYTGFEEESMYIDYVRVYQADNLF